MKAISPVGVGDVAGTWVLDLDVMSMEAPSIRVYVAHPEGVDKLGVEWQSQIEGYLIDQIPVFGLVRIGSGVWYTPEIAKILYDARVQLQNGRFWFWFNGETVEIMELPRPVIPGTPFFAN